MLTYKYKAISRNGAEVEGYMEALNQTDAIAKIKESCSVVTELKEMRRKERAWGQRRLREKELAILCSQFSIILGAGLPLVRAVELIAKQTERKSLQRMLAAVANDVGSGHSLARSFADEIPALPLTFLETVGAGEQSGTLEIAFGRLHRYFDKSSKIAGKIRGAMIYPVFTIAVAILVVAIIMGVAVPIFTESFDALDASLPLPTRMLITASDFCSHWWWLVLVAMAGGGICYSLCRREEQGRRKTDEMKLKTPILGKLARMKAASQFANTMSTLLAAGIPIREAVRITGRVIENAYIGAQIGDCAAQLEQGRSLGNALKGCSYLPELLIEMAAVGEQTGTLEATLDTVGTFYDNESDIAASRMLSLLEPIIICALAVLVLLILLAVYLPMFTMYGSL